MRTDNVILCGGLTAPAKAKEEDVIRLHLLHGPPEEKVNLRIEALPQSVSCSLPPVYHDLIEIAAYVYAADQAVRRSCQDTDTFGAQWRQCLRFHLPVRCPDFWKRPEVTATLADLLGFLGDHFFTFHFYPAKKPVPLQQYLGLEAPAITGAPFNQVAMFSGGLDSLAGAIDEIERERNHVAFVTHIPTSKNIGIVRRLREDLAKLAGPAAPPLHVGVTVNKAKSLGKEYTQRTRSFLFASLGAAVAKLVGLQSLRFYENGVISLNLPLCAQVVGGRATRTTHPRVLAGFSKLFSLLSEATFTVENPYLWHTKADVVRRIVDAGQGPLIARSVSCAHTWERTNEHTHCGLCSQCLDRRLAMFAIGAEDLDPASQYKFDIFTQAPSRDADRILTAGYIERARTLSMITSPNELLASFPQMGRAVAYIPNQSPDQAAQRFLDLHKRHGRDIERALESLVKKHAIDVVHRRLPGDCLIRIVTDTRMTAPAPDALTALPDLPANYMWRRGNVWEIRFNNGKSFPIQHHERGCSYLHRILRAQGETLSVSEVRAAVAVDACDMALDGQISEQELITSGFAMTHGLPRADSGDSVDSKTIASYRAHISELKDQLSDAKEFNNLEEIQRIDDAISEALRQFRRDVNHKGQSRKLQDLRKRERDALRNNIDRTIDEIREHDEALATHLADRKLLRLGVENCYAPEPYVSWTFDPPSLVAAQSSATPKVAPRYAGSSA